MCQRQLTSTAVHLAHVHTLCGAGRLCAAAVVTAGTSASLIGCRLEHNSIALWLSPASQAWAEKCLFRSNQLGCLWGAEGGSNQSALPPGVALDPGTATHAAPAQHSRLQSRVRARGAGRLGSNRGHVMLNLVQNMMHGRLWVSAPSICLLCLSFVGLLPPPKVQRD